MSSLLEYLNANGYTPETKKTTARDYPEPTIEFYASGQARLRGMDNDTLKYLAYHTTDNGIELFICEDKEEMKQVAQAFNWRTCETSNGAPNIRVGKPAQRFYDYIKGQKPDNTIENRSGKVAWDTLDVEDKKLTWQE